MQGVASSDLLLAAVFFLAAVLYSSVGHAGASGYLAAMAFLGAPTPMMRPTALVLNLIVASIATVRFHRAGLILWDRWWPFALGSIPMAFVGGALTLPSHWYRTLVGVILWMAAARLFFDWRIGRDSRAPGRGRAIMSGAGIGLLAGLTGTGGGIFLSPLLLLLGWAGTREAAGMSAAFILVNSAAGLAGNPASLQLLPPQLPLWAGAALVGGLIGSELGTRRLGTPALKRLLGAVLVVAGIKLVFY
jgi:uncharacterized membrane protein YfcA